MFTDPVLLILSIAAAGAVYVLLPVAADAYDRFRGIRPVQCPETGEETPVRVDAGRAARSALFGHPRLCVKDCGNWPGRIGCAQRCVEQIG